VRQIVLTLPTNLLCRFRALASELLCLPVDVLTEEEQPNVDARERHASIARGVHFHEALVSAVAEAMRAHASLSPMEAPPATLVPYVTVYSAVPEAAADFVAQLAARSKLTTAQAWHRVVLEFCERSEAPGLEMELSPVHVSGAA
jgi:hypothetical protein